MDFGQAELNLLETLWALSPELILLLAGALILGLDVGRRNKPQPWLPYLTLGATVLAGVAVISLWPLVQQETLSVLYVLRLDTFALTVKALALLAVFIVTLTADDFIRANSREPAFFYALLLFTTLAISFLGASVNLVMIFLAFDSVSLFSVLLAGFLRDDERSVEAAFKYFLYGAALSAVMLYGFSWVYGIFGTTDLVEIGSKFIQIATRTETVFYPLLMGPFIMILAGFAFKVAAAPFHQWAPDAYEGAPVPVTAFFSIGPKIAGFALLLRVTALVIPDSPLYIIPGNWQRLIVALAALTMTLGNLVALVQTNVKRLLAYSSIAQAGYMLVGVAALAGQVAEPAQRAITAVLLYLLAYGVTNLGVFAVVILVGYRQGSYEIGDFAGLYRRSPFAAFVLALGLISLAGIPPTAGFIGKLWLFSAAIEANLLWLAVLGVLNSVISLGYYWKLIRAAYLQSGPETALPLTGWFRAALILTCVLILLLGVVPGWVLPALESAGLVLWGG